MKYLNRLVIEEVTVRTEEGFFSLFGFLNKKTLTSLVSCQGFLFDSVIDLKDQLLMAV